MRFGARELLFVMLMIGLIAASYLFVLKPQQQKRAEQAREDEKKLQDLTALRQSTSGIADLDRKIEELRKAITFFEAKLPQEKEVDKILREVWQIAEANTLQARTIKTLKSERFAGYSEQPIQMSLAGDFDGFYNFLLQLEKLPRITRIHQMNLQKIEGTDDMLQAQMTLSIFFEPGASRLASVAP